MASKYKNILVIIQSRELGVNKSSSMNLILQKVAEEKAVCCELQETRCKLPASVRSTFLMSFSPDSTKVASTHGDHKIYVCDVKTGKLLHKLEGHPRTPWCLAFHPTSNDILASGCLGGEVRIWHLHGGSEKWGAEHNTVITSLAFHPSDSVLVIATFNQIHFWDWSLPAPFASCRTGSEREKVRFVKFDKLGSRLITGIANLQPPNYHFSQEGNDTNNSNNRNYRRATLEPLSPTFLTPISSGTTVSERRQLLSRLINVFHRVRVSLPEGSRHSERSDGDRPETSAPEVTPTNRMRHVHHEHICDRRLAEERLSFDTGDRFRCLLHNPPRHAFPSHYVGGTSSGASSSYSSASPFRQAIPSHYAGCPSSSSGGRSNYSSASPFRQAIPSHIFSGTGSINGASSNNSSASPLRHAIPSHFASGISSGNGSSSSNSSESRETGENNEESRANAFMRTFHHLRYCCSSLDARLQQLQQSAEMNASAPSSSPQPSTSSSMPSAPNIPSSHQFSGSDASGSSFVYNPPRSNDRGSNYVRMTSDFLTHTLNRYQNSLQATTPSGAITQDEIERVQARITEIFDRLHNVSNYRAHLTSLREQLFEVEGAERNRNSRNNIRSNISNNTNNNSSEEHTSHAPQIRSADLSSCLWLIEKTIHLTMHIQRILQANYRLSQIQNSQQTGTSNSSLPGHTRTSCNICGNQNMTAPTDPETPASEVHAALLHMREHIRRELVYQRVRQELDTFRERARNITDIRYPRSQSHIDTEVASGIHSGVGAIHLGASSLHPGVGATHLGASSLHPGVGATHLGASSLHPGVGATHLGASSLHPGVGATHLGASGTHPGASGAPSGTNSARDRTLDVFSNHRSRAVYVVYGEHFLPPPTSNSEANAQNADSALNIDFPRLVQDFLERTENPEDEDYSTGRLRGLVQNELMDMISAVDVSRNRWLNLHRQQPGATSTARSQQLFDLPEVNIVPSSSANDADPLPVDERPRSPPLATILSGAAADNIVSSWFNTVFDPTNIVGSHESVMNYSHRVQSWDFSKFKVPEISDTKANIVVRRCKIHNDASIDISKDGQLLVALVPAVSGGLDTMTMMFAVYSLNPKNLGHCLYHWQFDSNAISVSFSPLSQYLVIGLATSPRSYLSSSSEKEAVAQIFKLRFSGNSCIATHVRSLTQQATGNTHHPGVSLNSVQWLPQPGQGLIYGTNRGCLSICKPVAPMTKNSYKNLKTSRVYDSDTFTRVDPFTRDIITQRRNVMRFQRMLRVATHTIERGTQTTGTQTQNAEAGASTSNR